MSIHEFIFKKFYPPGFLGELSSEKIKEALESGNPTMIARFGSTEIKAILHPMIPQPLKFIFRNRIYSRMGELSGFFPETDQAINKFSKLMIDDMSLIDVLGAWRIEEYFLRGFFVNACRIELRMLEPYFSENPWTEVLKGKNVLIIHPFNKTIERQYYLNRELLFKDKRILPEFKTLKTIKAVQTVAGQKSEFVDWFEALDSMKKLIDQEDFDVAILGCGAYGFPLAAHIKRLGRKAVHLGGSTQILFGIKGRRWDNHPEISALYNDYWVRPAPEDVPQNAQKVEGGCYW
jgi:hypothetical protein